MQNKKSIIIASMAIILFVVVAFIFMYEPARNVFIKPQIQKKQIEEITGELPVLECNYANDQDAYKEAISKKDVNICSCINEDKLINTCKTASMNTMFYDQALQQLDETLCEKINSEIQKDACHQVVQSSVKQFKAEDPEYLARIYAISHNEKAIGELEQITVQDKENIDAHITLALAYAEKGLSEQEQGRSQSEYVNKALAEVENAKKIDDKNSEVYRAEGYAYEIKPDLNQARMSYQKALELDENNMLAHAGIGHVYRMSGVLEGAVEEFNKAANLDKNKTNVSIYTNLCNLEASRSNQEEAVKNCKVVTQMEDADIVFKSEALQIMAEMFLNNDDITQAKNYLLQAKTLTPNDSNLYVAMSKLYFYDQDYEQAKIYANKSIELSPTKASSYLALSRALYMQEKFNEAIIQAQKGITLVKTDVSLLTPSKPAVQRDLNYTIANSYRQLGNTQKQQEYEQKAKEAFENSNLITK